MPGAPSNDPSSSGGEAGGSRRICICFSPTCTNLRCRLACYSGESFALRRTSLSKKERHHASIRSSEPASSFPHVRTRRPSTRRKLLGTMAAAGALLGMNAAHASGATPSAEGVAAPPPAPSPVIPDALFAMARLRDYKCRRASSWDRTGGNDDSVPVEPGADRHAARREGHRRRSRTSGSPSTPPTACTSRTSSCAPGGTASRRPPSSRPSATSSASASASTTPTSRRCSSVAPMKALNCLLPDAVCLRRKDHRHQRRQDPHRQSLLRHRLHNRPAIACQGLGRFHAQYRQAAPCKKVGRSPAARTSTAKTTTSSSKPPARATSSASRTPSCRIQTAGSAKATT